MTQHLTSDAGQTSQLAAKRLREALASANSRAERAAALAAFIQATRIIAKDSRGLKVRNTGRRITATCHIYDVIHAEAGPDLDVSFGDCLLWWATQRRGTDVC
jgi:hypothetical protein